MISSANVVVRPARRGDMRAVLDVHARQGSRPQGPASQLERDTWAAMMEMAGLTVYVAEADDEVVATAAAMVMPNVTYGCAPTVFVEAVVVLPDYGAAGSHER
jgi:L-amino acid N-acyltransferase YncA